MVTSLGYALGRFNWLERPSLIQFGVRIGNNETIINFLSFLFWLGWGVLSWECLEVEFLAFCEQHMHELGTNCE